MNIHSYTQLNYKGYTKNKLFSHLLKHNMFKLLPPAPTTNTPMLLKIYKHKIKKEGKIINKFSPQFQNYICISIFQPVPLQEIRKPSCENNSFDY
jgi:hypothetical protein